MPDIYTGYVPRSAFMPFHERTQRWAVLVVHRRGGKTTAVIHDMVKRACECQAESPRYAYIAPTYGQAKDVAWGILKHAVSRIPGVKVSEGELHITLPGDRRIRLYGADNYDRLRGIGLDGVAIDESADMPSKAWTEVILPALSTRNGWVVWIGTPKGRDEFYAVWRQAQDKRGEYFSMLLPVSQSKLIPEAELLAQRTAPGMTQAVYDQEFECSFDAPIEGSIYGPSVIAARAANRISRDILHYASSPVYTAFDIGAAQNTKCWIFQTILDRIMFLECLTGSDDCSTPAAWAKRLKDKPYSYGGHFIPHDGETLWRRLMIEAGLQGVVVLPRPENEWDNINDAVSQFNRCSFNSVLCESGIEALEAFHSKMETDGKTLRNIPVHNWASHASTAFGYAHQAIRCGMLVDRSAMPGRAVDPAKNRVLLAGYNGPRPTAVSSFRPIVRSF